VAKLWVDVRLLAPPSTDPEELLEEIVEALESRGFRVGRADAYPGSVIVTEDGTFREHVFLTDVEGKGDPSSIIEDALRDKVSNLEVKVGRADADPRRYADGSVQALFEGPEGDPENRERLEGKRGRDDTGP